jgi:hypothetical protein
LGLVADKIADAIASATTTAVSAMYPIRHRSPMSPPLCVWSFAAPESIAERLQKSESICCENPLMQPFCTQT